MLPKSNEKVQKRMGFVAIVDQFLPLGRGFCNVLRQIVFPPYVFYHYLFDLLIYYSTLSVLRSQQSSSLFFGILCLGSSTHLLSLSRVTDFIERVMKGGKGAFYPLDSSSSSCVWRLEKAQRMTRGLWPMMVALIHTSLRYVTYSFAFSFFSHKCFRGF